MNKTLGILLSVIILGLALFLGNRLKEKLVVAENNPATVAQQERKQLMSKTDEQTSVTATVTPVDISPQSKEWKFDVVLNTHSVELDQDMAEISALVDDQGREYKPLRWEGVEVGGHHREGTLVFSSISPTPKSIELKVADIGGVVRSFAWQLQ